MKKYDIFYENIEDKENYLKILAQLLKQQLNISFHINGLVIELTPGMNEEEILNEITKKNNEFEKNKQPIKFEENESLLLFVKRISNMAKSTGSFYSIEYHNHQIKVVPGCTDFDILYQMIQINKEYLTAKKDAEYVTATPGDDYIQFGEKIFEMGKNGKNLIANFNDIEIPFTSDMFTSDSFIHSGAFVFSSMFNNMMYVRQKHLEAMSTLETKTPRK